jgi:hypothetical protein
MMRNLVVLRNPIILRLKISFHIVKYEQKKADWIVNIVGHMLGVLLSNHNEERRREWAPFWTDRSGYHAAAVSRALR